MTSFASASWFPLTSTASWIGRAVVDKTADPRAPLVGLAKVFETLADRAGFPAVKPKEDVEQTHSTIVIDLGDSSGGPDPKDAKIQELEDTIAMLLNGAKQQIEAEVADAVVINESNG